MTKRDKRHPENRVATHGFAAKGAWQGYFHYIREFQQKMVGETGLTPGVLPFALRASTAARYCSQSFLTIG